MVQNWGSLIGHALLERSLIICTVLSDCLLGQQLPIHHLLNLIGVNIEIVGTILCFSEKLCTI